MASDSWTSIKGSWRRTKEKTLRKFDKERHRTPYDEEYNKLYDQVATLSHQSNCIEKEMKKYLDSQRTLCAVTYRLSSHIIDCTESKSVVRPAATKFHTVTKSHGDPEEKSGRVERFLAKALTPYSKYLEQWDNFKKSEEDRNNKELDYDFYLQKVQDLQMHPDADPERLPRNEAKLLEKKQVFEHTHFKLKREMYDAWNKRFQDAEVPLRERSMQSTTLENPPSTAASFTGDVPRAMPAAMERRGSTLSTRVLRDRSSPNTFAPGSAMRSSRKRLDSVLASGPLDRRSFMPKLSEESVLSSMAQNPTKQKEDHDSSSVSTSQRPSDTLKGDELASIKSSSKESSGVSTPPMLSTRDQHNMPSSIRSLMETFSDDLLIRMPKLNLTKESIQVFPPIIFRFQSLESLNISHNSIQTIPGAQFAKSLPHLKELDLSHNHLLDVFDIMALAPLTRLTKLDIRYNPIAFVNQRVYLIEAFLVVSVRQGKYKDFSIQDLLEFNSKTLPTDQKTENRSGNASTQDIPELQKKRQYISPALSKLYGQLSHFIDPSELESEDAPSEEMNAVQDAAEHATKTITHQQTSSHHQPRPRPSSTPLIQPHRKQTPEPATQSRLKGNTFSPNSSVDAGVSSNQNTRPSSAQLRAAKLAPLSQTRPVVNSSLSSSVGQTPVLSHIMQAASTSSGGGHSNGMRYSEKAISEAIAVELRPAPVPRPGGPFRSLSDLNGAPITVDEINLAAEEIKLDMKTWKRKFERDQKITRIASRTMRLSPQDVARKEFLKALLDEANFSHRTEMQLVQYEKMRQSRKRDNEDKDLNIWVEKFLRNGRKKDGEIQYDALGKQHQKPSELYVDESDEDSPDEDEYSYDDEEIDEEDLKRSDRLTLLKLALPRQGDMALSPKDHPSPMSKAPHEVGDENDLFTSSMRENETFSSSLGALQKSRRLCDELDESYPHLRGSSDEFGYQLQRNMLLLNQTSEAAEVQLSSKKKSKIRAKVDFVQILRNEYFKLKEKNADLITTDEWKGFGYRKDWGAIIREAPQVDDLVDAFQMLNLENAVDFNSKQPKEMSNLSEKAIKALIAEDNKRIDDENFRHRLSTLRQNLRQIASRKSDSQVEDSYKKMMEKSKVYGKPPDDIIAKFDDKAKAKIARANAEAAAQKEAEAAAAANGERPRRQIKMIPPFPDEKKIQYTSDMSNKELVLACAKLRSTMKKDLQELADARDRFIKEELEFEDRRHDEMYLLGQFLERKYATEKIVQIGEDEYQYSKLFTTDLDMSKRKPVKGQISQTLEPRDGSSGEQAEFLQSLLGPDRYSKMVQSPTREVPPRRSYIANKDDVVYRVYKQRQKDAQAKSESPTGELPSSPQASRSKQNKPR